MEKTFDSYLETQSPQAQDKFNLIFAWIDENYPQFEKVIKWNQPMYTDHETFIIGFSASKQHISVSPEPAIVQRFQKDLEEANYNPTSNLFRITWNQEINFDLLKKMIDVQVIEKQDFKGFWR